MDKQMLAGKVAIISGASYGMGYTMAELFAREGAKVVMTARGKEKLDAAVTELKKQGFDVTGVAADNKELNDVKKVKSLDPQRKDLGSCFRWPLELLN